MEQLIVRLEGVSKQIQGQQLFEEVGWTIEAGERWGVIGTNGSGKSTLLKILAGLVEMDQGSRWVAGGYRVGYLPQQPEGDPELSVLESVYLGQGQLLLMWEEYQRLCQEPEQSPQLLQQLGRLQESLEHGRFFELRLRAEMALSQLGLDQLDRPLGALSGGQRRRVALAQVLTQQPDVLLLDEPTNHLDTASVDWLEGYLKYYEGAVVMVTHDRYFLDRIARKTLEIEEGRVLGYLGNYADYLEAKANQRAQAQATAAKRANLWRRELEWLRRGPRARATKQKARIERAESLRPQAQQVSDKLEISLLSQRLGRKVLEVKGLSKSYGELHLLQDFDFVLEPGDRVGIIGSNGSGKTTLLDLLTGRIQADAGTIEWGSTVKLGYFDQENQLLDLEQKVLESVREIAESIPLASGEVLTASQMCERFLFSGRLQHTLVGRLSGGERRRLHLLRVLMGNPNVLLLDEPSNDLDIPTLSCLEDYLDQFAGSILASSHDRYFLDRCVEQLLAFEGGPRPRRVSGSYSDYQPPLQSDTGDAPGRAPMVPVAPVALSPEPAQPVGKRRLSFKEKRELEGLEQAIAQGEQRQLELEQVLVDQVSNYPALRAAHEELESLKVSLEAKLERWTQLYQFP